VLDQVQPWAIINAAGYACLERAEMEPDACHQANAVGSVRLATAAAKRGIRVITFSSDSVFDGRKRTPYVESDPVSPLGAHGRSKAEAETQVLRIHPEALVIRAGAFFGPWDGANALTRALGQLAAGERVTVSNDHVHSPAYLPDLVHACLDLLVDGESGLWHLTSPGAVTPAALLRGAAEMMGLDPALVGNTRPVRGTGGFGFKRSTVLDSERGYPMPTLEDALGRYCQDVVLNGVKQA
jgi:dTDP-4-dehydrorhamnose reductase